MKSPGMYVTLRGYMCPARGAMRVVRGPAFDPRESPARWLRRSAQHPRAKPAGADPADPEEAELFTERTAMGEDTMWRGPLGRKLHWSTWSLHTFWAPGSTGRPSRSRWTWRSRAPNSTSVRGPLRTPRRCGPSGRTGDYLEVSLISTAVPPAPTRSRMPATTSPSRPSLTPARRCGPTPSR